MSFYQRRILFVLLCGFSALSCNIYQYDVNQFYINLNGSWSFSTTSPLRSAIQKSSLKKLTMPGRYARQGLTSFIGNSWLQKDFYLSSKPSQPLALFLGEIKSIDATYINGKEVGSTGVFPPHINQAFDKRRLYFIPVEYLQNGNNTITIHLYSPQGRGGIKAHSIFLAPYKIANQRETIRTFLIGLIAFALMLTGTYFILIYRHFKKFKEVLFFGIFSINFGIYSALYDEVKYLFFDNFWVLKKIEYLSLFLFPLIYLRFIYNLLERRHDKYDRFISVIGVFFLVAIIFAPTPYILMRILWPWQVYWAICMAYGMSRHIRYWNFSSIESRLYFAGYTFLIFFVAFDVLRTWNIHQMDKSLPFGLAIYLGITGLGMQKRIQNIQIGTRIIRERNRNLRKLNAARSRFFLNISHDIRTPLSLLTIPIDTLLMSNTNLPESLETLVKQIKQNLYKVISRISTMLDAARIEDSKDDFSPVQNDVVAYIYSILQQFNSAFNSHDIALQISLPEQAINMSYDPQKLERIIANLLSNAIKHNPNKRQVFFNVTQENETLLIKIKDLGQGIAKEKQKRIFHKFERGSTFKPGSGLGLSIVKQYVNLHRGKISINSEENKFTEFIINLPLNRQTKKTENIILANNDLYFTRQMANSFNHTSIKQPSHVIYLSEKPNTDIEQLFQDKLIIITNVTEVLQLDKPKIIIFDSNRSFSEIKDSVKTIKEKHPIAFLFIVVPFFEKNKISSLLKLGANEVFTEPDYLDELVLKLAFYFQLENYQNKIYR